MLTARWTATREDSVSFLLRSAPPDAITRRQVVDLQALETRAAGAVLALVILPFVLTACLTASCCDPPLLSSLLRPRLCFSVPRVSLPLDIALQQRRQLQLALLCLPVEAPLVLASAVGAILLGVVHNEDSPCSLLGLPAHFHPRLKPPTAGILWSVSVWIVAESLWWIVVLAFDGLG